MRCCACGALLQTATRCVSNPGAAFASQAPAVRPAGSSVAEPSGAENCQASRGPPARPFSGNCVRTVIQAIVARNLPPSAGAPGDVLIRYEELPVAGDAPLAGERGSTRSAQETRVQVGCDSPVWTALPRSKAQDAIAALCGRQLRARGRRGDNRHVAGATVSPAATFFRLAAFRGDPGGVGEHPRGRKPRFSSHFSAPDGLLPGAAAEAPCVHPPRWPRSAGRAEAVSRANPA